MSGTADPHEPPCSPSLLGRVQRTPTVERSGGPERVVTDQVDPNFKPNPVGFTAHLGDDVAVQPHGIPTRPQVRVRVETNEGGEMLRSFVMALLEPLVKTCDVYIEAVAITAPRTESPDA